MTDSSVNPKPATTGKALELYRKSFGGEPFVVARAPGRIEVIGNHTDYNCGTVIGAAIDRGVAVVVGSTDDGRFRFIGDGPGGEIVEANRPFEPRSGRGSWINYPLGVLAVLEKRGMSPVSGLSFALASDLPAGAGLSSSAAIELATAVALVELQGFGISRADMVSACREAENSFVGVPCGILDQGVSGFGRRDSLVHIDCREPRFSTVPIPGGVRFWVFNTHKKHALLDSLYSTRHAECMDAVAALRNIYPGIGCLADLSSVELERARDDLPSGPFRRAKHVVEEIARVSAFVDALRRNDLQNAGALLFASHKSSQQLFENSTEELDFLVDCLERTAGVYGARLTGGGFGGAAMAMTDGEFSPVDASKVEEAYLEKFGSRPGTLACATNDGAAVV